MTSGSIAQVQFGMTASGGFQRLRSDPSVSHEELKALEVSSMLKPDGAPSAHEVRYLPVGDKAYARAVYEPVAGARRGAVTTTIAVVHGARIESVLPECSRLDQAERSIASLPADSLAAFIQCAFAMKFGLRGQLTTARGVDEVAAILMAVTPPWWSRSVDLGTSDALGMDGGPCFVIQKPGAQRTEGVEVDGQLPSVAKELQSTFITLAHRDASGLLAALRKCSRLGVELSTEDLDLVLPLAFVADPERGDSLKLELESADVGRFGDVLARHGLSDDELTRVVVKYALSSTDRGQRTENFKAIGALIERPEVDERVMVAAIARALEGDGARERMASDCQILSRILTGSRRSGLAGLVLTVEAMDGPLAQVLRNDEDVLRDVLDSTRRAKIKMPGVARAFERVVWCAGVLKRRHTKLITAHVERDSEHISAMIRSLAEDPRGIANFYRGRDGKAIMSKASRWGEEIVRQLRGGANDRALLSIVSEYDGRNLKRSDRGVFENVGRHFAKGKGPESKEWVVSFLRSRDAAGDLEASMAFIVGAARASEGNSGQWAALRDHLERATPLPEPTGDGRWKLWLAVGGVTVALLLAAAVGYAVMFDPFGWFGQGEHPTSAVGAEGVEAESSADGGPTGEGVIDSRDDGRAAAVDAENSSAVNGMTDGSGTLEDETNESIPVDRVDGEPSGDVQGGASTPAAEETETVNGDTDVPVADDGGGQ